MCRSLHSWMEVMATRVWEDSWIGDNPLSMDYSTLYNIVRHKNVLMVDAMRESPLNIQFIR